MTATRKASIYAGVPKTDKDKPKVPKVAAGARNAGGGVRYKRPCTPGSAVTPNPKKLGGATGTKA